MDISKEIQKLIEENLSRVLSLRSTGTLKPDNTFVSKGDLLCEQLICGYLQKTLPGCMIISEESNHDVQGIENTEFVVTVDPIDGTENFVSGLKEWGIGICIYRNMRHWQSMIFLPELGISLCTGDALERVPTSRICGLSSYMQPDDFSHLGKGLEYRIMGCCMYNMYNVIKGSYCQFQHMKGCYSWDILPGLNLALEHGLYVELEGKSYQGEFLYPGIKYKFVVRQK